MSRTQSFARALGLAQRHLGRGSSLMTSAAVDGGGLACARAALRATGAPYGAVLLLRPACPWPAARRCKAKGSMQLSSSAVAAARQRRKAAASTIPDSMRAWTSTCCYSRATGYVVCALLHPALGAGACNPGMLMAQLAKAQQQAAQASSFARQQPAFSFAASAVAPSCEDTGTELQGSSVSACLFCGGGGRGRDQACLAGVVPHHASRASPQPGVVGLKRRVEASAATCMHGCKRSMRFAPAVATLCPAPSPCHEGGHALCFCSAGEASSDVAVHMSMCSQHCRSTL